jgi:hypothetical protein
VHAKIAAMGERPSRRADILMVAALATLLAAVALINVSGSFERPVRWVPDGLFYQAKLLELRGDSHDAAFEEVFSGPLSAPLRYRDPEHVGDPAWVAYNERFFERRVAVPAAGAAIEPIAGERALSIVSIAGYVAAVLAVFALLLLRFRPLIAAAVAFAVALLPALGDIAPLPLTDTWGVALVTTAITAAVLTFERGRRWIALWAAAILLLSFTRDSTWVPILAVAFCAWRWRSRAGLELAVAGVAAALPALLLFGTPMRELLAFAVSDFQPRPDASWLYIAERYPDAIVELVRGNLGFVRRGEWYTGVFFAVGLPLLFVLTRGSRDRAVTFVRVAALAAVPYVMAVPLFSAFRLELVFVPAAAFGLAAGLERLAAVRKPVVVPVPARNPAR